MENTTDCEILVGTYEDYIVGYALTDETTLVQSFARRSHTGSVKVVECSPSGKYAASAGNDETLNLYNLQDKKMLCSLDCSVNCLAFVDDTYLIAGSEDSNIYVYKIESKLLKLSKELKGHKKCVMSISIHPSSKLMISISKDNTMRTWNLIKGRAAYVVNINSGAHQVKWCPKGDNFSILTDNEIYCYQIDTGTMYYSLRFKKKVICFEYLKSCNYVAIGCEGGTLEIHDLDTKSPISNFDLHKNRVKSISSISSDDNKEIFASCSTDGTIKIWSICRPYSTPKLFAEAETGARITCLAGTNKS